jgi:hypothetical protein
LVSRLRVYPPHKGIGSPLRSDYLHIPTDLQEDTKLKEDHFPRMPLGSSALPRVLSQPCPYHPPIRSNKWTLSKDPISSIGILLIFLVDIYSPSTDIFEHDYVPDGGLKTKELILHPQ